jgi:hypothetical protein
MYQRAATSYEAFLAGLGDAYKGPKRVNETDELEVLGGRKSVITPKSTVNSPQTKHTVSPSTSNRESDGGSSPGSQTGAAEMLMDYYRRLDTSPGPAYASIKHETDLSNQIYYEQQQQQNHYPVQSAHSQQHAGHQGIYDDQKPVLPEHAQVVPPQMSNYAPASGSHVTHPHTSSQHLPSSPIHQQMISPVSPTTDKAQSQNWAGHPYEQQQQYTQYQQPIYMDYNNMPVQHVPANQGFGYVQQPAPHEPNQDEIWRNFMMGFGNS